MVLKKIFNVKQEKHLDLRVAILKEALDIFICKEEFINFCIHVLVTETQQNIFNFGFEFAMEHLKTHLQAYIDNGVDAVFFVGWSKHSTFNRWAKRDDALEKFHENQSTLELKLDSFSHELKPWHTVEKLEESKSISEQIQPLLVYYHRLKYAEPQAKSQANKALFSVWKNYSINIPIGQIFTLWQNFSLPEFEEKKGEIVVQPLAETRC